MTKYRFAPKDKNEARVIIGLLECYTGKKFYCDDHYLMYMVDSGAFIGSYGAITVISSEHRELKSTEWLMETALRGFKEAWEVPPDGYRLVTDEERVEFSCPIGEMMKYTLKSWEGEWHGLLDGILWDPMHDDVIYAVPLDFKFPDKQKKELEVSALDAMNSIADVINSFNTKVTEGK